LLFDSHFPKTAFLGCRGLEITPEKREYTKSVGAAWLKSRREQGKVTRQSQRRNYEYE
jgi:hypothetical protein